MLSVLVILYLAVFFLLSIPVVIVEYIISLFRKDFRKRPFVFHWVRTGFRCVRFFSGIRLQVIGEERLPENEAVLYIGNHQSYFDIVVLSSLVPSYTGLIGKKQMGKIPILSGLMRFINCLFLDRDDVRQGLQVILTAIDYVNDGISMVIYPEGTRNKHPDEFLPFHKGSFKIAQRTNCPIVPVTVAGTRDVYENHRPFIKSRRVIIEYGEPFRFSDLSKDEQKAVHTYTSSLIAQTYEKNRAALVQHDSKNNLIL